MNFNMADIIVAALILACVLYFSYTGLIMTVFNMASLAVSSALAYVLQPYVMGFLSGQSAFIDPMKTQIAEKMGLATLADTATKTAEQSLIQSLQLPDFLKDILAEGNNPEIHRLLGVNGVRDYVSSYLTELMLGVFVFIFLFLVVSIGMRIIAVILDVASRLPVINTLNRLGGAVLGLAVGVFFVFLLMSFLSVALTFGSYGDIVAALEDSQFARWFYMNNPIINLFS